MRPFSGNIMESIRSKKDTHSAAEIISVSVTCKFHNVTIFSSPGLPQLNKAFEFSYRNFHIQTSKRVYCVQSGLGFSRESTNPFSFEIECFKT